MGCKLLKKERQVCGSWNKGLDLIKEQKIKLSFFIVKFSDFISEFHLIGLQVWWYMWIDDPIIGTQTEGKIMISYNFLRKITYISLQSNTKIKSRDITDSYNTQKNTRINGRIVIERFVEFKNQDDFRLNSKNL